MSLIAAVAMLASCKEVDPLAETELGEMGVTSVKAAFTGEVYENDPDASFSAQPDANGNIVIEVPYFYPETSDYEVPEELLTNMRVSATLATGTNIEPGLGLMDLTQTHHITAYDAAGRTKEYSLTAKITKLSGCDFSSFNVTSAGTLYQGIINPGQKTISLMVTEPEITGCTVDYEVSPHAVVSGYTEGMTIKDGTKFTVTAHNETDKSEYTIRFAQPEKISYGARLGSEKQLWAKNYSDLGITIDGTIRLASDYDNLYVLVNGTKIYSINKKTGENQGEVTLPAGYTANSIVNDDAGHFLFAADAAYGTDFKVFYIDSFTADATPVELLSFSFENEDNSENKQNYVLGNIRVVGDVTGEAAVSATIGNPVDAKEAGGEGYVWQISNGKAESPVKISVFKETPSVWTPYNGCVLSATSNISSGVYAIGYWGTYDLFYSNDLKTFSSVLPLATEYEANNNRNALSSVVFNGARYLTLGSGAHFDYSPAPAFQIMDSSTPTMIEKAIFYAVDYNELKVGGFDSARTTTSDVNVAVSEDGFYMDVFITDGKYDILACYEFDCIQQ